MPYVKIHPIKHNIKASVDYILNPEKTSDELIYFSNCSIEDPADDFKKVRNKFNSKVTVIGRHIIQSYKKSDDIDYDKALKIAKDFCKLHLSNHQYIIAVHKDKANTHAHIIFNTVNLETGKAYRSNKHNFHNVLLKNFNDILSKNNLIIAEVKNKQVKYNYLNKKTLRDMLKNDIDIAIVKANNYFDFISLMNLNYYVKEGKYLSFKHRNYGKKFLRCNKNLGKEYTRENIKRRLNKNLISSNDVKDKNKEEKTKDINNHFEIKQEYKEVKKEIGFIINMNKNYKARTMRGYRNWSIRNNLKTINNNKKILKTKYNLSDNINEIDKKIEEYKKELSNEFSYDNKRQLQLDIYELNLIRKNIVNYKNRNVSINEIEI